MANKRLILLLLGPQGAGKGTQAEYLEDHFGVKTVSVGSMLRAEMKKGSKVGKQVEAFVNSGKLAPNDLVDQIVEAQVHAKEYRKGVVLDGYPRDPAQAVTFDKFAKISAVVVIQISDDEAVERLKHRLVCEKCGMNFNEVSRPPVVKGICDKDGGKLMKRKDDKPKAIRGRLKIYHHETKRVIEHYAKKGLVAEVDGEQPIVEVHEAIVDVLKEKFGIKK